MKDKFFLTFGAKYKYELHPSGIKIDPDGYIVIHAYNYDEARNLAFSEFGSKWSWLYDEKSFIPHYFPAGIMCEIGNKENLNV